MNALVCRTLALLAQAPLTQYCVQTAQQSNCKQINYDRGWGEKKLIIQEEGYGQLVKQSRAFLLIDSILENLLLRKCSYG